jgi:hypothetical protein
VRTAIAPHELLLEGLYLGSLSIETGRVGISAASGTRRSLCPFCGRSSARVHSRYSRTVSTPDRYSHRMPSMGRNTADGMDEALG